MWLFLELGNEFLKCLSRSLMYHFHGTELGGNVEWEDFFNYI